MSESDPQAISVHRENHIATVTLCRPKVNNALTPAHFDELAAVFDEIAANKDDRVMIITGSGRGFCAGADLSGSSGGAERLGLGQTAIEQFVRETTNAARSLHRIHKPTIAAVNGVAAGGGCNLALGCDIVFAGESARFCEVFVNRGLCLDYGGSWLLPRLIGLQRAKDIAFRGDVLDVNEANDLGLVLEVVSDEKLMERVLEYAAVLAKKPPIALSKIKTSINDLMYASYDEALNQEVIAQAACMGTNDFKEAMLAWIQKRDGQYTGE